MTMEDLLTIMQCLRDPDSGCPWDLNQDFASIAPHTLEEVYEVVDAIEREDMKQLRDELGDLLFQVVFYAQLGREKGDFDFQDIVASVASKLLHRHPHVFPAGTLESFGEKADISTEQVEQNWEAIKTAEREKALGEGASILDDVPGALPALNRARKLQKRAATVGFDWPDVAPVMDKLREEIAELEEAMDSMDDTALEEELGDVLFSVVNLARHLRKEPEMVLRKANAKFEKRFRQLEQSVRAQGQRLDELDIDALEARWQALKHHAEGDG